jgi:hypothetical protein
MGLWADILLAEVHIITNIEDIVHLVRNKLEAGQIGPKPNRPQVKSVPFLLLTIVNMQS